jgi:hypothetical protein
MQKSGSRLGLRRARAARYTSWVLYAWVHFNGRAESYLTARLSQQAHTTATITPRTLSDERDGVRHALLP